VSALRRNEESFVLVARALHRLQKLLPPALCRKLTLFLSSFSQDCSSTMKALVVAVFIQTVVGQEAASISPSLTSSPAASFTPGSATKPTPPQPSFRIVTSDAASGSEAVVRPRCWATTPSSDGDSSSGSTDDVPTEQPSGSVGSNTTSACQDSGESFSNGPEGESQSRGGKGSVGSDLTP
jgi:hypothetical protein